MVDEKKTTLATEAEDTLACIAFAEEGEPCPICSKKEANAAATESSKETVKKKSMMDSLEDDLACTAFYDQNESCPICKAKKE